MTTTRVHKMPALHPSDMADCACTTGEQHARAIAAATARWDAAYESLSRPRTCADCGEYNAGYRTSAYCALCRIDQEQHP